MGFILLGSLLSKLLSRENKLPLELVGVFGLCLLIFLGVGVSSAQARMYRVLTHTHMHTKKSKEITALFSSRSLVSPTPISIS